MWTTDRYRAYSGTDTCTMRPYQAVAEAAINYHLLHPRVKKGLSFSTPWNKYGSQPTPPKDTDNRLVHPVYKDPRADLAFIHTPTVFRPPG